MLYQHFSDIDAPFPKHSPFAVKVRALIQRGSELALIHSPVRQNFVLPGGGVDSDETLPDAFYRECKEELGGRFELTQWLGCIELFRYSIKSDIDVHQIEHIALGQQTTSGPTQLTEFEQSLELEMMWLSPQACLDKLKTLTEFYPVLTAGRQRDIAIIEYAMAQKLI